MNSENSSSEVLESDDIGSRSSLVTELALTALLAMFNASDASENPPAAVLVDVDQEAREAVKQSRTGCRR
jgi:hypothetical protein